MEFLYLLESIRNPVLDGFFSLITHLGSEIVFMALAVVLYWCVSKRQGLYLLAVGCLGTTINQFLKITFRIPRPWVRDPDFTIVEAARADATGYSFPSGHTQSAFGVFGCLARDAKRRGWAVAYWVLAVLVGFSRMYLGVHTPMDVGVSVLAALVLVFALHPLFRDLDAQPMRGFWILLGLMGINVLFLLYATCWPFPADADAEQLAHGVSNAAKLTGALGGMALGYLLDQKKVRFSPAAPLPGQILKCVLGLALVLAMKEGLKPVLSGLVSSTWSGVIRYGLLAFFAAGIWPMTFPKFAKLSGKKAQK